MKKILIVVTLIFVSLVHAGGEALICPLGVDNDVAAAAKNLCVLRNCSSSEKKRDEPCEGFVFFPAKVPRTIFRQGLFTEQGATPVQDRLINMIEQEQRGVCGAVFIVSNMMIARALVKRIQENHIYVKILVDRAFKQFKSEGCLRYLVANGAHIFVPCARDDKEKKVMHHKFLIFEENKGDSVLWNGSYNLSSQANNNNENVEITNDPAPVGQFLRHWQGLMQKSLPLLFDTSDEH